MTNHMSETGLKVYSRVKCIVRNLYEILHSVHFYDSDHLQHPVTVELSMTTSGTVVANRKGSFSMPVYLLPINHSLWR